MSSMFTLEMFEDEISAGGRKRYFVCTQNYHYKYYIVDIDTCEVKYGRIGNEPAIFSGYNTSDIDKKIREKLNKGYREVSNVLELKAFYLDDK